MNTELFSIIDKVGFATVLAVLAVFMFRYLIQSHEKKNNVIGAHIKHSAEVLKRLSEATERKNGAIKEQIQHSIDVLEKLSEAIGKLSYLIDILERKT